MKKKKSNLTTFCISHEYIKFLDELNINTIGSAGFKKKYPRNWLRDNIGRKEISSAVSDALKHWEGEFLIVGADSQRF